ncbi:DUF3460 family protein [Nitrogeniibacter mangrovi]|uniref:DUF3460 family protein n=1 Tax=Nitrogeniibacter mangrovi TaxID=2016596 RepID=A0A6C1AXU6_9RHOO|nr:DUF3460 family protein [Nitrogeniibacter mangrovi]QID16157.1 DUF3460 family protein [Nitrogeniibacter mangrovi]
MHRFHHHKGAPERAYVSEFTRFMEDFMDHHPEEREEQRDGWRIFWDKQVDLKAQHERDESEVPTPGYYYFDSPDEPH